MSDDNDHLLRVEALQASHDRSAFESGVEPLDRYLKTQAGQDSRKNMAAPYVLLLQDDTIVGYYTISSTAVSIGDFPERVTRKLPRYPLVPATLIGRLAVDRRHRGRGHGRHLLADALYRAMRSEIASYAVVVDAKDESARQFYERESFIPFPVDPTRLFLPIADYRKVFEEKI